MNEKFNELNEKKIKEQRNTVILSIIFVVLLVAVAVVMNILKNDMEKSNIALNKIKEEKTSVNINQEEYIGNSTNDVNEISQEIEDNINSEIVVIEVNENNFEKEVLKSDKKVLIDFYADWCGPCKTLSPIVEEFAKENPDIKVVKVDVDANENLSYKYNANYIPLLVVIENGKEVNRNVGVIPKKEILELVK